MASSFWHTHHGPKIREWRRAKGEATGTDKVPEMRLAGHRELREEVVLDARIVIGKKGRSGRYLDVLRQGQADRTLEAFGAQDQVASQPEGELPQQKVASGQPGPQPAGHGLA